VLNCGSSLKMVPVVIPSVCGSAWRSEMYMSPFWCMANLVGLCSWPFELRTWVAPVSGLILSILGGTTQSN